MQREGEAAASGGAGRGRGLVEVLRRRLGAYSSTCVPAPFAAAAAESRQSCLTARPQRRKPTRLPRPWDSPGKNIGVGCHFLLQCMKVKSEREVAQSCPTLSRPHGLQPTRLLRPWDFPGKSTVVECLCLFGAPF